MFSQVLEQVFDAGEDDRFVLEVLREFFLFLTAELGDELRRMGQIATFEDLREGVEIIKAEVIFGVLFPGEIEASFAEDTPKHFKMSRFAVCDDAVKVENNKF